MPARKSSRNELLAAFALLPAIRIAAPHRDRHRVSQERPPRDASNSPGTDSAGTLIPRFW